VCGGGASKRVGSLEGIKIGSLMFPKLSQNYLNIFYLLRRLEGRTFGVVVYAHLLWLSP